MRIKSAEFVKILDENKGAASAPVIKKFGEGIFADYSGLVSGGSTNVPFAPASRTHSGVACGFGVS